MYSYDYQTLDYDIMLIKLFHPVEVTEAVAPISLPTGCPYGGFPCSVSGWGNTAMGDVGVLIIVIHILQTTLVECFIFQVIFNYSNGKMFWKNQTIPVKLVQSIFCFFF